jgi:hypothetical protein
MGILLNSLGFALFQAFRIKWDFMYVCMYIYCTALFKGHAVTWLIEALCYKPEGRGLESRWGGYFQFTQSFQRIMALGSTKPLTEMSTRNFRGRDVRLTTLPPSMSLLSREMWEPRHLTTLWASTSCYRDSFTFSALFKIRIKCDRIVPEGSSSSSLIAKAQECRSIWWSKACLGFPEFLEANTVIITLSQATIAPSFPNTYSAINIIANHGGCAV